MSTMKQLQYVLISIMLVGTATGGRLVVTYSDGSSHEIQNPEIVNLNDKFRFNWDMFQIPRGQVSYVNDEGKEVTLTEAIGGHLKFSNAADEKGETIREFEKLEATRIGDLFLKPITVTAETYRKVSRQHSPGDIRFAVGWAYQVGYTFKFKGKELKYDDEFYYYKEEKKD